jgi:ribosomal protein S18 acetylase RimI-like enzyme
LRSLPEWFGIEGSNLQYVADLSTLPTLVAETDGAVTGFLMLKHHNPSSSEIHCLAVDRSRHRRGVGRALVSAAERRVRSRGAPLFHVKTRGPSEPDEGYEKTRRFYIAMGFLPLEETTVLWGPENPALIMVRPLG